MNEIINGLLPIFAVIALGTVLRSTNFAPLGFFRATNRLVYWVAIPCYLFYKTAEASLEGISAVRVASVVMGGMLIVIALGYIVARVLRFPETQTGAFVQGAYRGNLAYVGLPVALMALSAGGTHPEPGLEAAAVITLALSVPAYNIAAVPILIGGRGGAGQGRQRARQLAIGLATNPLLLACLAGLIVLAAGWRLPAPLRTTCKTIGDMNTPLALLAIGASLTFTGLRTHWRVASIATAIKLAISPLIGLMLAALLGLSASERQIALIFLACPTAAASYVMAQQLGADEQLAANIIVVSTVLSALALAVVLAVT